jgi:hypothetical protein
MINQIPKEMWGAFCDDISKQRLDWQTSVQIVSNEIGAQTLSDGLPLLGLTFGIDEDLEKIELITGTGASVHQIHTIFSPQKLMLESGSDKAGGILNIEDDMGTQTLISFLQPAGVLEKVEKAPLVLSDAAIA